MEILRLLKIKEIIEDFSLDEYVRDQAFGSLLILLNNGVVSREKIVFYFKELFNSNGKALLEEMIPVRAEAERNIKSVAENEDM